MRKTRQRLRHFLHRLLPVLLLRVRLGVSEDAGEGVVLLLTLLEADEEEAEQGAIEGATCLSIPVPRAS